ncbi:MAG TPA: amino acid permease [Chromatiales bacterium]|nr:amino acid permease [Chromatiales bacterium]
MKTSRSDSPRLKRSLSLPLLTFYGLGTILGAGIYVLVGKVGGSAGMYLPVAFFLAAVLASLSALSYAELSARYPLSAGDAVYVQQGFGRAWLSRLVGLLVVLASIVSVATLVHGFAGYLDVFFPVPSLGVVVLCTLVLGGIAAWGISQSVVLAALLTVVEIGGLLLILWVARGSLADLPARWPELVPPLDIPVWHGIVLGSVIAFYAFIGFEDIVNVAEEVHDPSRNLPRAILLALVVTTLAYLVVALAAILTLPPSQLAQTDAPLAMLYTHLTGQAPLVITVISLLSVLNGALIQIIKSSRVLYGMSRQGWLPAILARVHPVTRTPLVATVLVTGIVLLFGLWLPLLSLARLTSFLTLIVFSLINLALWQVKRRDPRPAGIRPIPLWVPVAGFLASGGLVIYQAAYFAWD